MAPPAKRIAADTLWNLAAAVAPLPVALVAIPVLIRNLGANRFGLLALSWTLVGYFSLFDFGLGRALTQFVAAREGSEANPAPSIPAAFWTALALMAMLGTAGGALLAAAAIPIQRLIHMPPAATCLVAAAIPTITITAGLRGYLEARRRFAVLGPIRAATGALLLLGPVAVLPWSKSLAAMLASIVAVRVLSMAAHLAACFRVTPRLWTERDLRWSLARPLARFGGWLTVTNIVSPLMVSMDRFLIGAQLSATDVAYYATPYEIVTKFLILPAALVGVLFPAFSAAPRGPESRRLYRGGMRALALVLLPMTAAAIILARPGLRIWVGPEMAQNGYRVLRILAAGVFVNGMAQIPFSFLQGVGRPDLTAKFHLAELPVYAAALWCGIHWWGIEGAAVAWAGRVTVDAGLLMWCARECHSDPRSTPAFAERRRVQNAAVLL